MNTDETMRQMSTITNKTQVNGYGSVQCAIL